MNSSDLTFFEAVARHGGVSSAAQELLTVQSNVTARIRQLEESLGHPLFVRHSRGMQLTPQGETLLPYAQKVIASLELARAALSDREKPRGRFTLGSLETTAALRLADLLGSFMRDFPCVELSLVTNTTDHLIEEVTARRLEGAFVAGPVLHPELVEREVWQEELVLLSATEYGTLDRVWASPAGRRFFVFRKGCAYRRHLESLLGQGNSPYSVLEFGNLDTILAFVKAGLGVTLLPKTLAKGRGLKAHRWKARLARVTTVLVRRAHTPPSPAMCQLLKLLP